MNPPRREGLLSGDRVAVSETHRYWFSARVYPGSKACLMSPRPRVKRQVREVLKRRGWEDRMGRRTDVIYGSDVRCYQ